MKKNFLLLLFSIFLFSGCFSFSSLNPFSDSDRKKETQNKTQIVVPDEAPQWLKDEKEENAIFAIGITKDTNIDNLKFFKQRALINAGNNLSRKIFIKTVLIYQNYLKKASENEVFENDIRDNAKEVALQSLKLSKIKGFWENSSKKLFVRIKVDTKIVAEQIQQNSKKLFKVDQKLYENILSNRAKEDLIKELESDDKSFLNIF